LTSTIPDIGAGSRTAAPATKRLAWLDVLRAIAALMVVQEHIDVLVYRAPYQVLHNWFEPGFAGVSLFFLISGYIIPASLESRGDLRRFWVSRVFRLYPLYTFVMVALVLLQVTGMRYIGSTVVQHKILSGVAQFTLLSPWLGLPAIIPGAWTLTHEMLFYLMVTGLFVAGRHRASGVVALLLVGSGVLLEYVGRVPALALIDVPIRILVPAGAAVLALALGAIATGRRRLVVAGGFVGGVLAVTLLAGDLLGTAYPDRTSDTVMYFSLMFVGTTIRHVEYRRLNRGWLVVTSIVLFTVWVMLSYHTSSAGGALGPAHHYRRTLVTLSVVGGLFALGMALRHRRLPRILSWLGLISYSIYLVHLPILEVVVPRLSAIGITANSPTLVKLVLYLGLMALVIVSSAVIYRLVEAPPQRWGRLVANWLDARRDRANHPAERSVANPPLPDRGELVGQNATGAHAVDRHSS
jgi:peptidoglycan/LPS O-acetylase OafA/YrhL